MGPGRRVPFHFQNETKKGGDIVMQCVCRRLFVSHLYKKNESRLVGARVQAYPAN